MGILIRIFVHTVIVKSSKRMAQGKYYTLVQGTTRDNLERFAQIAELHKGYGLSYLAIAGRLGIPKSNVQHICNKLRPQKGSRDFTITIMSELDSERAITNEMGWSL